MPRDGSNVTRSEYSPQRVASGRAVQKKTLLTLASCAPDDFDGVSLVEMCAGHDFV